MAIIGAVEISTIVQTRSTAQIQIFTLLDGSERHAKPNTLMKTKAMPTMKIFKMVMAKISG
jgi:hypothetical protein